MPSTQYQGLVSAPARRPISRSRLRRERRQAIQLWPRLACLSPRRLAAVLQRERILPTWGLFARFLSASRAAVVRDPASAAQWARSACRLAETLPAAAYPQIALGDLKAATLVAEAEALRFLGQPIAARDRICVARSLVSATPDVRFTSEICRIEALVAAELGDEFAALSSADRAILAIPPFFRRPEYLRHLIAQALAVAPFDAARARGACAEALDLSNEYDFHRVVAGILQASAFVELSEFEAAAQLISFLEPFTDELDELGRIHLLWVRARIATSSDEIATLLEANRNLQQVLERLDGLGRERDRALVEIDLVLVETLCGRRVLGLRRVHALAERLAKAGAHSEIVITLRLLFKLLTTRADPREILDQARTYLSQAWWLPRHSGRRSPSSWPGAEVPFGHLPGPISRSYIDDKTFEPAMHLAWEELSFLEDTFISGGKP